MESLKELARGIFEQALAECSIERSFDRMIQVANGRLLLGGREALAFDRLKRVRILAAGKAARAMLDALLARLLLPSSCDLQGVLIAGERPHHLPSGFQLFAGGHPSPNEASFDGAAAALSMLQDLRTVSPEETLCIFLISGGASAMMELPLDAGISLDDTVAFHRALVASGANIVEMNCVRKHFSAAKGGRLAVAAGSACKISLLVSDVPPEHLDALASGPTIPDPTTVEQCRKIIARYSMFDRFPASVCRFFQSPDLPETPKPGELNSPCWKLLDSDELIKAAQIRATALGFHAVVDNSCDDWTYDTAADYLLDRLRKLRREHSRVCLISGGEIAVRLPHSAAPAGAGGRNQHLALYLATQLHPNDGPIAVLSAGSDGIDGNSPAAGAVVDEHTLGGGWQRSEAEQALAGFDSYSWLHSSGATVVTGPTGHNLRDLRILLATPDR
jgi:glycerate 2-kinase